MEFNMDIDTGGTFTDGFVRGDGRIELVKVDTTPHDFSVCFMECIEEAARRFGFTSATQLLAQMKTLRLSTTIGTNSLIQANGPKLGLLVTREPGENGYAPPDVANPAVDFLVPRDMIIGIEEGISESGLPTKVPIDSQVLTAVKTLLERGARRIVVSLSRSPLNPAHEKKVRDIVLADYPAHYLGTVPLLLSTEVSRELDDQHRTNAALINAYIHQEMMRYLYKADEEVRNRRSRYPLLIVHATGGVARVAKTKALDTCDSGPAAGLLGAAFLARKYGLQNVVTVDIGGTSTDIGLVLKGEPSYNEERQISGVPIRERFIESTSIGGGGSSKARLQGAAKQLKVGPESAGATPGPACFGLGGNTPTITDAWVVLGYIDPDYFLGGKKKLDAAKARAIIEKNIANPLKITVEQAAEAMVNQMYVQSAESVAEFMKSKGVAAKDAVMFAFGGAGGLGCGGISKAASIPAMYVFPFGAAFCAFGSSCTDVLHNYSAAKNLTLGPSCDGATLEEFNRAVREMTDDAYFDMGGEGFQKEQVSVMLEVVLTSEHSPSPKVVRWEPAVLRDNKDVEALLHQYRNSTHLDGVGGQISVKELRLKAFCHLPDPHFPVFAPGDRSPRGALKGKRAVYWNGKSQDAQIYEQNRLKCGNVVSGLAIIESASTSVLVPPGSRYLVDQYLNGVIEEE